MVKVPIMSTEFVTSYTSRTSVVIYHLDYKTWPLAYKGRLEFIYNCGRYTLV